MSCFLLSPETCKKITAATSNYWWSGVADKRGVHWKNLPDITLPKCHGGMCFRDIKLFNLAMLGKQGWRLMSNPDSLCARVLKGKYFPQGEFMTTGKKKNSSSTWRVILAGRKVLEMGLIKRIGDGVSTNIWSDRWIPTAIGNKPICMKDGATAIQVSELLTVDGRSWDGDALNQNLLPLDVEAVKLIPLGRAQHDFWGWSGERHGFYTVRSAYRLLSMAEAERRAYANGRSSHSAAANDLKWKKLWKQHVPPKVRVFWWRVVNDFMPSRANLHRKHIDPIANCAYCGTAEETTFHALIECPAARAFWSNLKKIEGIKLPRLCPRSWAVDLLDDSICREKDRVVIMCAMWSLWSARNDRNHGKTPIESKLAIDWALDASSFCWQPDNGTCLCPVRQNGRLHLLGL